MECVRESYLDARLLPKKKFSIGKGWEMVHLQLPFFLFGVVGPIVFLTAAGSHDLPEVGKSKVAYYAFDATPVGQGVLSLTSFTDNANIVVVFEGTLWELADTVHYSTGAMRNAVYTSKKQILNDIQTLRKRGVFVLMNLDDAASWSTSTPFTTWNGKALNYIQFAAFVDSCVTAANLDGISLDVEHKAVDNTNYRNLIKELGGYFGPLSSNPSSKIYTGAFYTNQPTAPGTIFREVALGRYLNFVMDMGYKHDNAERFNYWAATLGNSKVMDGMSHQYNTADSAVSWAAWHPTPDKAGVMVFAANVNKAYTDTIFAALGNSTYQLPPCAANQLRRPLQINFLKRSIVCKFSFTSATIVSLRIFSLSGKACGAIIDGRYEAGDHTVRLHWDNSDGHRFAPGAYDAVLTANEARSASRFVVY
jgi:hypothetical protein